MSRFYKNFFMYSVSGFMHTGYFRARVGVRAGAGPQPKRLTARGRSQPWGCGA